MLLIFDKTGWSGEHFRTFFAGIDAVVYKLVSWVLEGIFNLINITANPQLAKVVYSRIYLILGVFMIFKLTFSFINYMINPDSMVDKQKGVAKVISRTLVMLAILIIAPTIFFYPISFDSGDENILSKLQKGVLNTLPNIILGTNSGETVNENIASNAKENGEKMAVTMLRAFYYEMDCDDNSTEPKCLMTEDQGIDTIDNFEITVTDQGSGGLFKYKYMWPLSTIAGIALVVILLGIAVDVAIRVFKLLILEIIAPIPIMSYIDPKSSGDGTFGKWLKTFGSTYIDIFIKMGSVYILLLLFSKMFQEGGLFDNKISTGMAGKFVNVMLIIGLFKFIKDAPKFIKDALGLKDSGNAGIFDGIKSIGTLAGLGAAAGGMIGAARTNWRASSEENKQLHPEDKGFINGVRNVGSALFGGVSGGLVGAKAALGKDGSFKKVLSAQAQRNATRASHATALGGLGSAAYGMFTGRSLADRDQAILDSNKSASSSIKDYKAIAVEESKKKGKYGFVDAAHDRSGGKLKDVRFNYAQLEAAMNSKDDKGDFYYSWTDRNGNMHNDQFNVSWFDSNVMADIEDSQTALYLNDDYDQTTGKFGNDKLNTAWRNAEHDMREAEIEFEGKFLGQSNNKANNAENVKAYKQVGIKIGEANKNVTDMSASMKNIKHRANKNKNGQ